jgi:hypothetical protein
MASNEEQQQQQQQQQHSSSSASAFCLIVKDDNDILSEWIAYHYSVFNMRRLIVAVDPDSEQNPYNILKLWGKQIQTESQLLRSSQNNNKNNGNSNNTNDEESPVFELEYTIWNDEYYTPLFFKKQKIKALCMIEHQNIIEMTT